MGARCIGGDGRRKGGREGGNDVQGEHWLHGRGILKVACGRNSGCRRSSSGIVGVRLEEGALTELESTIQVLCWAVAFVDVVDGRVCPLN